MVKVLLENGFNWGKGDARLIQHAFSNKQPEIAKYLFSIGWNQRIDKVISWIQMEGRRNILSPKESQDYINICQSWIDDVSV